MPGRLSVHLYLGSELLYKLCVSFAGLVDEQQKVRTISALAIAALAEAATPYGIESFDSVLKPLWKGIRQHRGKVSVRAVCLVLRASVWIFLGLIGNLYINRVWLPF